MRRCAKLPWIGALVSVQALAAGVGIGLLAGCSSSKSEASAPSGPGHSDAAAGDAGRTPLDYSKGDNWACGPAASHDYCLDPQTVSQINADGSAPMVTLPVAKSPKLDCFYVYPTVDNTSPPGNETNFNDMPSIVRTVMSQAAPFTQECTVFAPLYRQATFSSYSTPNRDEYLDAAFVDIAAAFSYYLDHLSNGRKFVLFGHSQGAHMLRRLIQRVIEPDASLLARLVVAMPIGAVGDIVVPNGALVGGSFQKVPLCSSPTEMGCVITFDAFAVGNEPDGGPVLKPDAGASQAPCTNPGSFDGGVARYAGSLFATLNANALFPVTTDLALYPDLYTGQCVAGPNGWALLDIGFSPLAGDMRTNPVILTAPGLTAGPPFHLGLHGFDLVFPMRELLDAVGTRASAL
jgi:hypothetical protein